MLQRVLQDLQGDFVVARDGRIGSVKDVYFDDERWAVRYLVVDTGNWLPGRKVLVSPVSVDRAGSDHESIQIDLTREQVERAPGVEEDAPVSRLYEAAHARHYGYPYYWSGPYLWGPGALPMAIPPLAGGRETMDALEREREAAAARAAGSHLRSGAEVAGYRIAAADGEIGHVEDFVVDPETWAITAMVVDTRNWLPGKKVLVSPEAIADIDWNDRKVRVRLTRDEVKEARAAA